MTLRVAQVNCVIDREDRPPDALLEAWPTLPAVAHATREAGADVTVVQASRFSADHRRDGLLYRFVAEPRARRRSGPGLIPGRLAAAVAGLNPDLVHFNGLDFPLHARAIARLGVPLLLQDHSSDAADRIAPLRRWGHRRVAGAAFTAAAQADPFIASGQLPRNVKLFVIPESSSHFTPGDAQAARLETGLFGDPVMLWVGRLGPGKDPLTMLRAVRSARDRLPGLQLWCAFGTAELLPDVEAMLAGDPELAARVRLLGCVPHARVEQLCRASDLFLSSSLREGSGYALIEALACGVTPVVSDIPAFRALTGGAVGALVRPGDVEGFARAIVDMAAKPRSDERLRVRRHFEANLSFARVGAKLVEAYASMAGNGSA